MVFHLKIMTVWISKVFINLAKKFACLGCSLSMARMDLGKKELYQKVHSKKKVYLVQVFSKIWKVFNCNRKLHFFPNNRVTLPYVIVGEANFFFGQISGPISLC